MDRPETFTEAEILRQLDLAWSGTPNEYYPKAQPGDIQYSFFLDLEHGYFETAGSRIHLYADSTRWAIVFEKNGYSNRGTSAEIELDYVGNCITYPVDSYRNRNYITNSSRITLMDPSEFERIENTIGSERETFEFIGRDVKEIKLRDKQVLFNKNHSDYERVGIRIGSDNNAKNLIRFRDLVRYLNATDNQLVSATEEDIRKHIPHDLPKLMVLDEFHFVSIYDKSLPPSAQETYQLIAKVLRTGDVGNWKPKELPNNHWSNWESGNL